MKSNMQRLGDQLTGRMKKTASAAVPTTIELGTINANLSLTTDSIKSPIPKGDYLVNKTLTGSQSTSSESHTHSGGDHEHSGGTHAQESGSGAHTHSGGSHTHSGGDHAHKLPGEYGNLKAGDRVLVAWCGNDAVVICKVVSS